MTMLPGSDQLPESLTLDEAFRAAFYVVLAYVRRGAADYSDAVLLVQYMRSDPARWSDWQTAVHRALLDVEGVANADHDGLWRDRPEWPA